MELRDVVGYEEFFSVTEDGRVYSKRTNKFLVQGTLHTGYKVISSRIGGRYGKCICVRVHRMVAQAFIPNPDNKPSVNHKDGNKTNNHVSNLEWVTVSENNRHAWDTGLASSEHCRGERNVQSVLTEDAVRFIRKNYIPRSRTNGARALGRKFGVDKTSILRVISGESWFYVTD